METIYWFVICLDDYNRMTFATKRWFATEDLAQDYAATVSANRCPQVIYSFGIPAYEEHSFGKGI
jgi:hypothetical protein